MFQPVSQVLALPPGGTLTPGDSSGRLSLRFPRSCWVVGLVLSCGEGETADDRAFAELAISDERQRPIFSDGIGEAFAPVALLSPGDADAAVPLPLLRRVRSDETWTIEWQCSASRIAGSVSPVGALLLVDDPAPGCRVPDHLHPSPAGSGMPPITRVVVVPNLPASLAAGETSSQSIVEMPSAGLIVGMRASAAPAADRATIAVEVYDPERREVLTTGVRAMAPVALPLLAPGRTQVMPLAIERRAHAKMSVRVQNLAASAALGSPSVAFLYRERDCGC